jgi:hypothetical protein
MENHRLRMKKLEEERKKKQNLGEELRKALHPLKNKNESTSN